MYRTVFNPIADRLDPESVHQHALDALRLFQRLPGATSALRRLASFSAPATRVDCLGLLFRTPVGLAAGFDKNGEVAAALSALGFSHVEIGTVTPEPQTGNDRPRIVRVGSRDALLNSLGFPSVGARQVAHNLGRMQTESGSCVLGANVGPNRVSMASPAAIARDYVSSMKYLNQHVSYFALNISSPNTPGLTDLQDPEVFSRVGEEVTRLYCSQFGENNRKPILIKLGPNISPDKLTDLADIAIGLGFGGFVATNSLPTAEHVGTGRDFGLSGRPIAGDSSRTIRSLFRHTEGQVPIIGVGGVFDGKAAIEKVRSGACLVQLYTGLVYEGPLLPRVISRAMANYCDMRGLDSILDVRGIDAG